MARSVLKCITFAMLFSLMGICAGHTQEIPSLINSYNPAVREGVNVWVDVDLLYWQPWEKALVATNYKSDVFVTDDFTLTSLAHPHFDWSFGYRVKSGYLFASNLWDVEASWTHFSSHVSQHRSTNGSTVLGMFPIWSLAEDTLAGDYVFVSDLKWKFTINALNLQFGRYLNVLSWLDLKPFVGLNSFWIKQQGNIFYQGGIFLIGILQPGLSLNGTDFIQMKNNYWGMGPTIGLLPRFILGRGVSLNLKGALSGLAGFFKINQQETYLDTTRFSHHAHLNRLRWAADFSAGISWKQFFAKERYSLTFGTDWQYQIFFHQFEFKTDDFGLVPSNRDLSVQGANVSIRFDF